MAALLPAGLAACSAADSKKYPEARAVHEIEVDWREDVHYITRSIPTAETDDFLREARRKGWEIARVERDPTVPDRFLVTVTGKDGPNIRPDMDYSMTQGIPTTGPGIPPAERRFLKKTDWPGKMFRRHPSPDLN